MDDSIFLRVILILAIGAGVIVGGSYIFFILQKLVRKMGKRSISTLVAFIGISLFFFIGFSGMKDVDETNFYHSLDTFGIRRRAIYQINLQESDNKSSQDSLISRYKAKLKVDHFQRIEKMFLSARNFKRINYELDQDSLIAEVYNHDNYHVETPNHLIAKLSEAIGQRGRTHFGLLIANKGDTTVTIFDNVY